MRLSDEIYMTRCLQLARLGAYYVAPNPMVGAVLVDEQGRIVAEGWHEQYGGAHAEVNCLNHAGDWIQDRQQMHHATLYVNLEPCSHYGHTPPCALRLIEVGIGHVVIGQQDPNPLVGGQGIRMLREAGIDVRVGVMENECRELNKRFLCLMEQHRPYVLLKWAQTQDGFMDTIREGGKPLVISCAMTKQIVHRMRAENMAIMVGTRTALLDRPKLKTTHWPGRHPIRVVPDRHHCIEKDNPILSDDVETIVYHDCTDWGYILKDLAERKIHSMMVEGGATLLRHILQTGIWDEMHIEVAPVTIGQGVAAPQVDLPAAPTQIIHQHLLYEIKRQV